MKPKRISTERLQAMLNHANSRAMEEDQQHRAEIRQELAYRKAHAILAGCTQPWEDEA